MMRGLVVGRGLRTRYNAQTGVTRVDLDPTTARQLRDAAGVGGDVCIFDFCPGADTDRIKSYYTCRNCAAIIQIRRALKRLGIEP